MGETVDSNEQGIYRFRPNLLHTESSHWYKILFLGVFLFPWRSDRPASVHATVNVLLFLFRWFQYLASHRLGFQRFFHEEDDRLSSTYLKRT